MFKRIQGQMSYTGDSRWLELRSLEVLDLSKSNCDPVFFLYKTKQIYSLSLELTISPSSLSLEPRPRSRNTYFIVFHSLSREVGSLVHTSQACNYNTVYLDSGKHRGLAWTC